MIEIIKRNNLLLPLLVLFYFTLQAAPSFSRFEATDIISGENIILSTQVLNKKGTVLVFMSSKCPCSNSHVTTIKELAEKHKDFSFYIIHSNVNEDEQQAKSYFSSLGIKIPILQDNQAKIADSLKAYKTPHAFILNPKGEIIYKGGVTDSNNAIKAEKHYLADALEDADQNRPLRLSETKTLGCFISREKD